MPKRLQFDLARLLVFVVGVAACLALTADNHVPIGLRWLAAACFLLPLLRVPFPSTWKNAALACGLAFCAFYVLVPRPSPDSGRRANCMNNLSLIARALQAYHRDFGCFPPAYITDTNGRPIHSWRVLILPYLERSDLYESYHFDEPWDGPRNKRLHSLILSVFCCAKAGVPIASTHTSYVALVGPQTVFPGDSSRCLSDISDGPWQTLLLVEVPDSSIHWMEPRDISTQAYLAVVQSPLPWRRPKYHHGRGNVAYADGRLESLPDSITNAELEAQTTIAGGEAVVPP
ncbi:MAG: DUF1559 domain-containing protein [Pirellulales bacterium]